MNTMTDLALHLHEGEVNRRGDKMDKVDLELEAKRKHVRHLFRSRGSMVRFLNSSANHQRELADVVRYEPDVDELDGDVEVLLWRIFTHYSINGNPQNPMFLRAQTFVEFCVDAKIVDGVNLIKQDCNVIYKDIVSKRADNVTGRGTRQAGGFQYGKATLSEHARQLHLRHDPEKRDISIKKMNFSDFVNALSRIALRLCPMTEEEAFELMLDERVFRYAHRRPVAVTMPELALCSEMYDAFAPAFRLILQYYGEFRPQSEVIEQGGRSKTRRLSQDNATMNTMVNALGFQKFLHFCEDFNLRSSMNNTPILTSIQLSEIFLNSVKAHIVDHIGKLTFDEFWEAIVRCAMVAYQKHECHPVLKLKELFVYMSHKIETSISKAINAKGSRNVSTNAANGLAGMKAFQYRVTEMYRVDGVPRTYLIREAPAPKSGRDLLKRMKEKRQRHLEILNSPLVVEDEEDVYDDTDRTQNRRIRDSVHAATVNPGANNNPDNKTLLKTLTKPLGSSPSSPKKVHDPTLPEPWKAALDPNGNGVYYYNAKTGMTTWDRPG